VCVCVDAEFQVLLISSQKSNTLPLKSVAAGLDSRAHSGNIRHGIIIPSLQLMTTS
jgi:hypothetical protein